MCAWGTETPVRVVVPAEMSHTGQEFEKEVGVDACIAPLVAALQAAGIRTSGCCCGHGKEPGLILLANGVQLTTGLSSGNQEREQ